MRKLVWMAFAVLALAAPAAAQGDDDTRWEIGGGYSFFSANIVPECACFHMHGASVSVGYRVNNWFGLIGDFGGYRTGSDGIVAGTGQDMDLLSYQFGARAYYHGHRRATAFAQAMIGGGRASGSIYRQPIPNRPRTGPDYGLMLSVGGGVDYHLAESFSLRLVQAEWVHSRFDNGSNNLQNSVRLTTGFVIRINR